MTSPWSPYGELTSELVDHKDEIAKWRQGDLITGLPIAWIAPLGLGDKPTPEWNAVDGILVDAIVCSQTCDIAIDKVGKAQPFVLVAPLVESGSISSPATAKRAKERKVGYLYPVPSPKEDRSGTWFVDLRLVFPISKAVLLGRKPDFRRLDPVDAVHFSEHIAHKFRRPALADALSETIPEELDKWVEGNGPKRQAFAHVEEVRYRLVGDRLDPTSVGLIVMETIRISDEERTTWHSFDEKVKSALKSAGIEHQPVIFVMPGETQAPILLYQQSVPLANSNYFPVRHW